MKVLHLLQSSKFSGAENVACQIIDMMKEHDCDSAYCSRDGQISEALAEREISFYPVTKLNVKSVKKVIEEFKPDVIHAHDMMASFVATFAAGKIPIISHIHNNSFASRKITLKSLAYVIAALKAKRIIWVSDSAYNGYIFHSLIKDKSEVLYNIIDIEALHKKCQLDVNKYDYDIVYVGRLTVPKNPSRLLEVFRMLVDKNPSVKLAIVGTGELEEETKAKAEDMKLMGNLDFLGFQNNPYKILSDSKAMILVSLWEGTPMCVLEAISLGVPVVSTPTDGVKVVLEDGKSGFISDDNQIIVDHLMKLIEDENLRDRMSTCARDRANELMNKHKYSDCIKAAYETARNN